MRIADLKKVLRNAKKKGRLGRSAQVDALIPLGRSVKQITKEERSAYMARFRQKYPDCSEVRLHSIWTWRIGELIPRYIVAAMDSDADMRHNIIHVFVQTNKVCNHRLMRIMGRRIILIDRENADFWKTVFLCSKAPLWKYYKKYSPRKKDLAIPKEILCDLFILSDEERAEAEEKIQKLGLRRPFVCISNRDSAYLREYHPENDIFLLNNLYRNSKISACSKAAEYLRDQGLQTVRMGRYAEERADFASCIDYANDHYDELLDIVLPRSSKFFVTDTSGVNLLAYANNIPVASKNLVPLNGTGWGSMPQSDKDLFICKKYYLRAENRYLSIREMLEVEARAKERDRYGNRVYHAEFYQENGIELVENSEEDIYDLVKEMNERLDGTWVETEETIRMQEQVQKMLYDDIINTGKEYHDCIHCKISIDFLKHNPFLLE